MPTPRYRTITTQVTIRQADEGGFTLEITAPGDTLPQIMEVLYQQCTFRGLARQAIAQSIGKPRQVRGRPVITLHINRPPRLPISAPSDPAA